MRRPVAYLAVVVGAAVAGTGLATPAAALGANDVASSSVVWHFGTDPAQSGGRIADADFDLRSVDVGYTSHAFDGVGAIEVDACGSTTALSATPDSGALQLGSSQGGTVTSHWSITPAGCSTIEVDSELTLSGNFARWSIATSAPVDAIRFSGTVGPGADAGWRPLSSGALFMQDASATSPSQLWHATSDGTAVLQHDSVGV